MQTATITAMRRRPESRSANVEQIAAKILAYCHGRASKIMLNGVSVAVRTLPKSALRDRRRQLGVACLRPKGRSDRLIERGRDADHGRGGIEHPADRIEVVRNRSPAAGSTMIQLPSGFDVSRTWRAAPR